MSEMIRFVVGPDEQIVPDILRKLPGFEDAPTGYSPKKIMTYFAGKDGVREEKFYDDDPHLNNTIVATGI